MAPSVTMDNVSDFEPSSSLPAKSQSLSRTLLLSPPSLSSHPEKLDNVLEAHDRSSTDIQMLDRLALSLVSLPDSTYDTIIILTDADNTRTESQRLLNRTILPALVQSLKPNGHLRAQDGTFASPTSEEYSEAILGGLLVSDNVATKPAYSATHSVSLRFSNKKAEGGPVSNTSPAGTGAVPLNLNGKRVNGPPSQPAGVGFVDFSDDLSAPTEEIDSDDELIDEDTLLDESDLAKPIVQRSLYPDPPFLFPQIIVPH